MANDDEIVAENVKGVAHNAQYLSPTDSSLAQGDDSDWREYVGETLLVISFLGVAFAMLAIPFVVYATYSGSFRWIITLGLVTVAAVAALWFIYPLGARPRHEPELESFGKDRGNYEPLMEMADRASQGFSYSQKALNERMAEAFLEKLRIRKGLDPGEVFRLSENEKALAVACGDSELAAFVVRSKAAITEQAERKRFTSRRLMASRGAKFNVEAARIIERIEAWEG
ncbi:MAG: hypothetical protein V1934_03995 [Methanobacteriota archaeon]